MKHHLPEPIQTANSWQPDR